MKKIINLILCLILALVMAMPMVGCGEPEGDPQAATFVSLDINPEIELTVDANDKVISVYGVNEDGKVLLFDETDLVGKSLDEVVGKITDLAVELGYLTEDNKAVATSVTSTIQGKAEALQNSLSSKITATAKNLGLTVSVDSEAVFSVLRKLEEYKAQNPDNQLIQGLSVEKFKLALSASETGEVSLDVAVTLDDSALIEKISSVHTQVEAFATDTYNKLKAEALLTYDKVAGAILDNVYSTHYIKNVTSHFDTFWYGSAYQVYKTMARGFGDLSKIMRYVEKSSAYPIDQSVATEVLTTLGLDASKLDLVKDSDGNVTLDSIEAYLDVWFKNHAQENIAPIQAKIKETLKTVDSQIESAVKAEIEKYGPQIEQVLTAVDTAISSIDTVTALIPEGVKAGLNSFVAEIKSLIQAIETDVKSVEFTSAKLAEYSANASVKADQLLQQIKTDLSEEELAEIQSKIDSLSERLSSAKKAMEDALASAEKSVTDRISALKESRKTK